MAIIEIGDQPISTFAKMGTIYPISKELRDYLEECQYQNFEDGMYCETYSIVLFENCLEELKEDFEEYGLCQDDIEDLEMLDKIAKDNRVDFIQLEVAI